MFRRSMIATMLCGLLCVGVVRAAEETQEGAVPSPATAEQVSRWVKELDDNLFDVREQAQLQLEAAGSVALDGVAQAAEKGSLESATRALNILLTWSEADDYSLRIAALERIAQLPQRPTESQLAGEILADAREEAALAKIDELGGAHVPDPQYGGGFVIAQNGRPVGPVQVIIGSHWKGGVDGLKYLKEVRRATTLSMHSSPLGDDAIPALAELNQVKRIELYGSKISSDGVAKLKEKLPPDTTLAIRSGAQLGIQGSQLTAFAQVGAVIEGSAAARAGLQRGDVIAEINGEKIKDFVALTDRIATFEPGDSAVLKVERPDPNGGNAAQLEIKVTFDKWGESQNAPTFVDPSPQQLQGQILPPTTIRIERR